MARYVVWGAGGWQLNVPGADEGQRGRGLDASQ
jgi:hypothetical protein